ncbi:ergothioneine biosynthesis protein EgtB [Natronocella acetinitrilica]|uniref:Ergothioneine biosynthesis protein EgtB n=1 Tax=Natronocella acetinitrilica TaxID=414046 RepID=A0AAE3KA47_9GAMM|nr:ergothioneine biosynthesis protein EgtB [Natronocella acetinitrilica]MCP1673084.1 ergothioneine biosynthesis protein EgtB [Natronocella acetinitrilica]
MLAPVNPDATLAEGETLGARFARIRATTEQLTRTLTPEDQVIQTMPDVSPTKWHLAHVTWFFEEFVLKPHLPGYEAYDPAFGFLFNSYYNGVGSMHPRPQRGLLSRPGIEQIRAYRRHVDDAVNALLARNPTPEVAALVLLGTHHEQQHQELLLTDIKHVLSVNPLRPQFQAPEPDDGPAAPSLRFLAGGGGLVTVGHGGEGFYFDNETPRHRVFLEPHAIANRPVTNGEYREFIRDGGYQRPELWLSDGWSTVRERDWERPLYWEVDLDSVFTLGGVLALDPDAPVCHVSYYEADAFARWAGARLPLEAELEIAAETVAIEGNLQQSGRFHPARGRGEGMIQIWGDVWEWSASPYTAYPGFRPPPGAVGEYNGKFMCNQLILRGGSCVTPADHLRPTYRNFFYPDARWQFSGIRLARDSQTTEGA